MLTRRFKRLVSLLVSLFMVALFVTNLRRGHHPPQTWGMLLTRGLDIQATGVVQKALAVPEAPLTLRVDDAGSGEHQATVEANDAYDEHEATKEIYDDNDDNENYDNYDEYNDYDEDDVPPEVDADDMDPKANIKRDGDEESKEVDSTASNDDDDNDGNSDDDYSPLPESKDYREIFSLTTKDRKFFTIYLGGDTAYNPSLIPHPTRHDLWIVIAQRDQSGGEQFVSEETLVCNAGFFNGVLVCTGPPTVLPVTESIQGKCEDDLAYINLRPGSRDARMFNGPEGPYIVYGSQSSYTCLGIWLQDVRMLLQDFRLEQMTRVKLFRRAAEVRRPPPLKPVEKNFFVFWDSQDKAYIHHDIYPNRVFAQLSFDGSVGPDLAPAAATKDGICMAKYMPSLAPRDEFIHQATNSLSITLCRRSDPFCIPSDANTFIMTIFQHKAFHDYHSVYEPYVMLFQRSSPFAIYAISQRPLWIHGRGLLTTNTHAVQYDRHPDRTIPEGHSEMFYITSMSWKTHGQRYHGYIDDPLFLAIGIEDSRPAAMDVVVGDLLQDLAFCSH